MPESVEVATILLVDLVDSTQLAMSVGPGQVNRLLEEHFELVREAIASFGGRELRATGDGLMAAFSSASAAVESAVAMQQLSERRYRHDKQTLHVRIGLSTGEATLKDGVYVGIPTIEAARLCAEAPSDGILISAHTKMLAGPSEGVEFTPAGELRLSDVPEPVETFSVSWAPLGASVITTRRVFISYAMADRVVAREVAEGLRANGMSVWFDQFEVRTGDRLQDVIHKQLDESDTFVLLISSESQYSRWARHEMSEVLKRTWSDPTKLVVPVLIGDARLPGYLRDHHVFRAQADGSPDFFDALRRDLIAPGATSGVHRTPAGDERLERRLADLQSTAAKMAAIEGDD